MWANGDRGGGGVAGEVGEEEAEFRAEDAKRYLGVAACIFWSIGVCVCVEVCVEVCGEVCVCYACHATLCRLPPYVLHPMSVTPRDAATNMSQNYEY